MIQLPNNCRCSQPKISIKQKTGKWRIVYRYYQPDKQPYFVEIDSGINNVALSKREKFCKVLIAQELDRLRQGLNPQTKTFVGDFAISPGTPMIQALSECLEMLDCTPHTKEDIRSTLKYITPAAVQLHYNYLQISEVRRKHIKALLNRTAVIKPTMDIIVKNKKGEEIKLGKAKWTNNTFNSYRKNLSILFEELVELEATEVNPVLGIKKKKHAVEKKTVLTKAESQRVDQFARKYDPRFWMLIHIFYHSGARRTELFKVQGKHVDLRNQSVRYMVLKGKQYEWVERPIVDEALPFWRMAMQGCRMEDYLFSVGLAPGEKQIRPEQITRRWERHIKGKLGIEATWYSLKHLNTTNNVEQVFAEMNAAQEVATEITGHKSASMIAKVYDIRSAERAGETLKKSAKKFG